MFRKPRSRAVRKRASQRVPLPAALVFWDALDFGSVRTAVCGQNVKKEAVTFGSNARLTSTCRTCAYPKACVHASELVSDHLVLAFGFMPLNPQPLPQNPKPPKP